MTPRLSAAHPLPGAQDVPRPTGSPGEPRPSIRKGLLLIRSTIDGGHWSLQLEGELDLSNSDALDQELRQAEPSAETITIDLRGLSFMDSSGLHVISRAEDRLNDRLRLRPGPRAVQAVFRHTGTEEVLPFAS